MPPPPLGCVTSFINVPLTMFLTLQVDYDSRGFGPKINVSTVAVTKDVPCTNYK
jgi:hypothetical protein